MIKTIVIFGLLTVLLFTFDVLFGNGTFLFNQTDSFLIFQQFRLPRALSALAAGGMLSVSGLLMQNVFKNPLAGPDVLGISQGAALMVALTLLAGVGFGGIILAACLGAFFYLLLLVWASKYIKSSITLLLIGVMGGFIISAIISTLQVISQAEALKSYVIWSMGSFSKVEAIYAWIIFAFAPFILFFSMYFSKAFDTLLLGNQKAQLLGINSQKVFFIAIIITAIATGVSTAFCGPIAFVGLAAPHLCKWFLKTYKHQWLIPVSFFVGASMALLADILSGGIIGGFVLPLNATLSILAAPVIIYVIVKKTL